MGIIIHQIFFRARNWPRRVTWPNMPQLKLGNIREYAPGDIPQFSNFAVYVRAFSFHAEKIIHLNRTDHAELLRSHKIFRKDSKIERPCFNYLKDNKDYSLHLGRKYARIFVLGNYLFLEAHSFPRDSLSENCSLLGTDNVRGKISEHIFAANGGYC